MMNVGNPDRAFDFAAIPNRGVGLARLEFIINRMIGVHPRALLEFDRLDADLQGHHPPPDGRLLGSGRVLRRQALRGHRHHRRGLRARARHRAALRLQVERVRQPDRRRQYEPVEENPMLGFRGAARYVDETFRPCFELECRALKRVREQMGLKNVWVMVPFVRTLKEAQQVVELLAANGLKRGEDGLKVIMMCELPTNAVLADRYLEHFDGMSIGSNDMTQLTLGLDRDSAVIARLFDERDDAVKAMLHMAIQACRKAGKYIGICGQGPSDHPDLARWLLDRASRACRSIPDTVVETWLFLAGQPTACRPASACASVPPSTYSSSPPTGTPCAMREARMPRRADHLGQEVRGGLALHGRVGGEDHLADLALVEHAIEGANADLLGADRRRAARDGPSARSSSRGSCRTARSRPRRPATRRRRAGSRRGPESRRPGTARPRRTSGSGCSGRAARWRRRPRGDLARPVAIALEQVERHALRRLRAHARQAAQRLDQAIERRRVQHARHGLSPRTAA
jgi:hypothetical protein